MIHQVRATDFRWAPGYSLERFCEEQKLELRLRKIDGIWVRTISGGTGGLSRVGGGFALDIVTGRAAGPGARSMYLALLTALPTDSATISTLAETTMTGYARQAMVCSVPTGATPPSTGNTGVLTFGPLTGTMVTISHGALVSPASGTVGDFAAFWVLTAARTPVSGDSLQAAAQAFTITDE